MSKVLSVLLLAVALGFVVGVATAVFRVAAAAEDGVLLIMGPFFGAFFAFLFVRIGDALKRVYERRVGHHSALVRIEHYLNDVMSVLHDNIFLATGFIETLRVPVESGAVRASSNRLSTVPLEREKLLDLLNLDLVNDLFTFHVELRKLNDSIGSQARLYDRALESLSGTHRDLEEYKGNTERAVQAMKMIFVGLRHAHKESIDLSAKVRVLARDMPFFVWIMHVFTPLHYKVGFERVWRQEVEKVQAEMRQSEQESGKRIDDMEEELRTMR